MVLTCKIVGRNFSPHQSISVISRHIYRLISIDGVVAIILILCSVLVVFMIADSAASMTYAQTVMPIQNIHLHIRQVPRRD